MPDGKHAFLYADFPAERMLWHSRIYPRPSRKRCSNQRRDCENGLVVCCSGFDSEVDVIKVIEQALNIKSYEVISEGELNRYTYRPQQEVPASTTPATPQPEKVEEKPAVQAEPVAPQPKAKQATVETSKPAASAQPAAAQLQNANAKQQKRV